MKVRFIPTGDAPDSYSFDGDTIEAKQGTTTERFYLSALSAGDKFTGVDVDDLTLPGSQLIRDAYRDQAGELHVTLCQRVGAGHWEPGEEIDAADYDPEKVQVTYRADKPHAGKPAVWVKSGKVEG